MRQLRIWVFDSSVASGVTGPLDVFAIANAIWAYRNRDNKEKVEPLFEWRVESPDGKPVRTPSGVTLNVDGPISARGDIDAVIIPGIFFSRGLPAFIKAIEDLHPLFPLLRKLHERGAIIATNCSASFLTAEAGLLDRRPATTTWWLAPAFRQRYPCVDLRQDELLTEKDGIMCSGAATAYLNMALRLVEKFAGHSLSSAAAKMMLIDANRVSQAAYKSLTVQEHMSHSDEMVARAQRWMERRLPETFRLRELAQHLSTSERTIIRRFKQAVGDTPVGYLQAVRIETAKRLLETSALHLDAVSERVGYGDLSSFRRLFKRETGLSPREYRQRFVRRQLRSNA